MGASLSNMQSRIDGENDVNAALPWWVKLLAKAVGIFGGFLSIFFAVLGLISFSATCILAAFLQLVFGVLVISLEAPFCCMFIDFIEKIAMFSESRKHWHKAVLYCAMGIIPIMMCIELNTILGSGTIFLCGVVYGFMSLGKKADFSSQGVDPAWNANVNQQIP